MATKINANVAERVKKMGIKVTNEKDVRAKLLEILEKNGIEQMEDEETMTLVEIAESFVTPDDDDNGISEDDDNDALAKEVEEETQAEEEFENETPEDEDQPEENEGDEFDNMDRTELKKYIKVNSLPITVKKSWSDDDIREKIRENVNSSAEEETEEEIEEPKKETPKKEKKEPKKAAKKTKRGNKLDPKNNEDDRDYLSCLKDLFPEDKYIYAWVASAGVTIKHKGKNSNRSLVGIENCTVRENDGKEVVTCNLYLLVFNNKYEALEKANIDFEKCWSGAPLIKNVELTEAMEIISVLKDEMDKLVGNIDKKLGDNRKKMEENLKKGSSSKKTDDETEEEVTAKKVKKTVKK